MELHRYFKPGRIQDRVQVFLVSSLGVWSCAVEGFCTLSGLCVCTIQLCSEGIEPSANSLSGGTVLVQPPPNLHQTQADTGKSAKFNPDNPPNNRMFAKFCVFARKIVELWRIFVFRGTIIMCFVQPYCFCKFC